MDTIDSICHPRDMALSIDLILETILDPLNGLDLFKCRLVSRHWNSAATSRLQKQLKFGLKFSGTDTLELEQFVDLLREHYSPGGILSSSNFPCSKFNFDNCCILDHGLLSEVLALHGDHITDLGLNFTKYQHGIHTEALMMEKIYSLIFSQVPNLHRLKLNTLCRAYWRIRYNEYGTPSQPREFHSPLLQTDPEFLEIHSKYHPALNRDAKVLRKLKFLDVSSHFIPAKILEMIILLAPNLKEVVANTRCQVYFLQPLDRLHLLKKLWFKQHISCCMKDHSDHLTPYERIAQASEEGRLKLREITVSHPQSHYPYPSRLITRCPYGTYDMTARIINVLCRILEGCKNSLEVIHWSPYSFFTPGLSSYVSIHGELDKGVEFKFPEVMPKIRKVRFRYQPNLLGEDGFPSLRLWSRIFPNLETLVLCGFEVEAKWRRVVMNITKLSECPPFGPLREILIHTRQVITEKQMNLFQTIFPNATVVVGDVCKCSYFF